MAANKTRLRELLATQFNEDELYQLATDLGIEQNVTRQTNRIDLSLRLIEAVISRKLDPNLFALLKKERPLENWEDVFNLDNPTPQTVKQTKSEYTKGIAMAQDILGKLDKFIEDLSRGLRPDLRDVVQLRDFLSEGHGVLDFLSWQVGEPSPEDASFATQLVLSNKIREGRQSLELAKEYSAKLEQKVLHKQPNTSEIASLVLQLRQLRSVIDQIIQTLSEQFIPS